MSIDARREEFEHVELFGKKALFTNARIDPDTIPDGIFCYHVRGSDSDPGELNTLELHVAVNHAGSILTAEKIKLPKTGYLHIRGEINFLGEDVTLDDYCAACRITNTEKSVIRDLGKKKAAIQKNICDKSEPKNNQNPER